MPIDVKICGLTDEEAVAAAIQGGARFLGVVFFPPSPRAVTADLAGRLLATVPDSVLRVGLFVDPDDSLLERTLDQVRLDIVQLHGKETPDRVRQIRQRFQRPVMKAIAIAEAADLQRARTYEPVADRLLFDAKPPKDATRPGGNALTFDWNLLAGQHWTRPWMLAGGINLDNLRQAIRITGATGVDLSSAVESAPGKKDPAKIRAFLELAAQL